MHHMASGTESTLIPPPHIAVTCDQPTSLSCAEMSTTLAPDLGILSCKPATQRIQEASLPLSILTPQKNKAMSVKIQVSYLTSERGVLRNLCNMRSADET